MALNVPSGVAWQVEDFSDIVNMASLFPEASSIEVDLESSDTDYALASDSSTTQSLESSILDHVHENGRRYHRYRQGGYLFPNDEAEQDRLDMLHHIFLLVLEGKLYKAPLPRSPRCILDIGTGTGLWALDVADDFPGADVLGIDLSPIQPYWYDRPSAVRETSAV